MAQTLEGKRVAALVTDGVEHRGPASDALLVMGALAGAAWWMASRRRRLSCSFRGRTVLISGGARGLGLALARAFAAEGAHLVLFSRSAAELERARRELGSRAASVTTVVCDIREPESAVRIVDRALRATSRIDVLVNNAGIIQMEPFEHATDEDFDAALQTFFWGPLRLVRACLPHLRRQQGARIVNISSIGGRISVPHLMPYSVGKFALSALSDGLQAELAAEGIKVTTVTPGLMRTGSHRNVLVRGRHKKEALWFGLSGATPLTSMDADRAARGIVEATRRGRARLTLGWQARAAQMVNVLAPELAATAAAAAATWLLPAPAETSRGNEQQRSLDLDLGWASSLMPSGAGAEFNQPGHRP
jgi:NAD(P)-dependent dehydrogenase (short-subunit alcohol dehydrogenase family)